MGSGRGGVRAGGGGTAGRGLSGAGRGEVWARGGATQDVSATLWHLCHNCNRQFNLRLPVLTALYVCVR